MKSTLWTNKGERITLGKKLGTGGEGAVFAVNEHADKVAKIYHVSHLPDADKQEKLRFMSQNAHDDLISYVAWVEQTLHKRQGGRVIGFVMNKISDCSPIYMLYNPSHRRQLFPRANWLFLLYTARNVAAAIATLHKHGHVIGDINQGNLLFRKNSRVVLIDADSFQIQTPSKAHLCQVGVAHFTPPELQGNTQFSEVARTANHDCFGLALLIFHLLFAGRHPFSGVPLIADAGNLLEHDIKHYRYAYAPDHTKRGIKPPPTAFAIDIVPDYIQILFQRAFTETGRNRRPTAHEWIIALDKLRKNISVCSTKGKLHTYANHLRQCPWCEGEKRGLRMFERQKSQTATLRDIPKWDVYQRVLTYKRVFDALPDYNAPITSTELDLKKFHATPTPWTIEKSIGYYLTLPFALIWKNMDRPFIGRLIAILIAIPIAMLIVPLNPSGGEAIFFIFLIVSSIAFFNYLHKKFNKHDPKEIAERKIRLSKAKKIYNSLLYDLKKYENIHQDFLDNKAKMATCLQRYEELQQQYKNNRISQTEVKRNLPQIADELETLLSKNGNFVQKLERIKLETRSEYLGIAQKVAQAKADLNA